MVDDLDNVWFFGHGGDRVKIVDGIETCEPCKWDPAKHTKVSLPGKPPCCRKIPIGGASSLDISRKFKKRRHIQYSTSLLHDTGNR